VPGREDRGRGWQRSDGFIVASECLPRGCFVLAPPAQQLAMASLPRRRTSLLRISAMQERRASVVEVAI
jgi:hypothetical protein